MHKLYKCHKMSFISCDNFVWFFCEEVVRVCIDSLFLFSLFPWNPEKHLILAFLNINSITVRFQIIVLLAVNIAIFVKLHFWGSRIHQNCFWSIFQENDPATSFLCLFQEKETLLLIFPGLLKSTDHSCYSNPLNISHQVFPNCSYHSRR